MKRSILLLLITLFCLPVSIVVHADEPVSIPPPSDDAAVWYLTAALQVERDLRSFEDPEQAEKLASNTAREEFDVEKAGPVIDRLQSSLDWARHGAKLSKCGWPVTLEEDGPYALLPHLAEMRRLSRLMVVSAMVKHARGDLAGSADDCIVLMRMARHSASDGTLIGALVQISVEGIAIDQLASQLDRYDRTGLEAMRDTIDRLPPRVTMAQAVKAERLFALWLERMFKETGYEEFKKMFMALISNEGADPTKPFPAEAEISQSLEDLKQKYDELEKLMQLAPKEFSDAWKKFDQQVEASSNLLIQSMLPSLSAARTAEFAADSKLAMLKAMVAYRLGGEEAFNKVVDPYDGKPFGREVTGDGVVLRSRLIRHDKPWSLTFPAGCAKPLE